MALIKGKQIQSLQAAKVVETSDKRFVTDAQIATFTGKAEPSDVEGAKTEASEALAAARIAITSEIGTAKTQAVSEANQHSDAAVAVVDGKVVALESKVTSVENSATTGLQNRYTKDEVDQRLAQLGAGIKYKGTVASFSEIASRFPNPEEGWLVASESDSRFYIYDADTTSWEHFPIEIQPCTTHTKTIRITVTDSQTVIKTGIKTNGSGALQTSTALADEVILNVNGFAQTKTTDYTVAVVTDEVEITWKSSDFNLEATDVVTVTYNQIV